MEISREFFNKEIASGAVLAILFLFRNIFKIIFTKIKQVGPYFKTAISKFIQRRIDKIAQIIWDRIVEIHMRNILEEKFTQLNNTMFVNSQKIDNVIRENQAGNGELLIMIEEIKSELALMITVLKDNKDKKDEKDD
jgi:hypothetical protein